MNKPYSIITSNENVIRKLFLVIWHNVKMSFNEQGIKKDQIKRIVSYL